MFFSFLNEGNKQIQSSMNIFIPFIEPYVSSSKIENVLASQGFGRVTSIELHEKKIKTSNKKELKSAKHNYAFMTIELFETTQGNNMRNNLSYNKTTHVMFDMNHKLQHIQLKPHLTVEDRLERGFELHIPNKEGLETSQTQSANSSTTENKQPYTNEDEDEDDEDEEKEPEWLHDDGNSMFSFDFSKSLDLTTLLSLPDIDIGHILHPGEQTPRPSKKTFYDEKEQYELEKDCDDIMIAIEQERENYQDYVSLLV